MLILFRCELCALGRLFAVAIDPRADLGHEPDCFTLELFGVTMIGHTRDSCAPAIVPAIPCVRHSWATSLWLSHPCPQIGTPPYCIPLDAQVGAYDSGDLESVFEEESFRVRPPPGLAPTLIIRRRREVVMDHTCRIRNLRGRFRLVGVLGFATMFCTSTYADRPILNEQITIDSQVDTSRHVEEVIVSNTAQGDYRFEFMATRLDLPASRERWTITYEYNAAYDFVQQVEVDGVWRYTVTYEDAFTTPRIAISVPGNVAVISALDASTDPNLPLFQQLSDETTSERAVVLAVALEMQSMLPELQQAIPQPNPVEQCITFTCPAPQPSWCVGEYLHCLEAHTCCVTQVLYAGCWNKCVCKHGPTAPPDPADCDLIIDPIVANELTVCLSTLITCAEALD